MNVTQTHVWSLKRDKRRAPSGLWDPAFVASVECFPATLSGEWVQYLPLQDNGFLLLYDPPGVSARAWRRELLLSTPRALPPANVVLSSPHKCLHLHVRFVQLRNILLLMRRNLRINEQRGRGNVSSPKISFKISFLSQSSYFGGMFSSAVCVCISRPN